MVGRNESPLGGGAPKTIGIRVTGSGKIMRERAFGNHILAKKSKSRKRNMKTAAGVEGKIAKNVKTALGA